jgi:hypothetical protein
MGEPVKGVNHVSDGFRLILIISTATRVISLTRIPPLKGRAKFIPTLARRKLPVELACLPRSLTLKAGLNSVLRKF